MPCLSDLCSAGVEAMTDMSERSKTEMYKGVVASIISLLLAVFIIAIIGKFLWNETMPMLFTFARPVRSCWQIIGLMLLIAIFR